jgi:flavorubredoxin
MRMVTLTALGTDDQSSFEIVSKRATEDADVLLEYVVVVHRDTDHLIVLILTLLIICTRLGFGTLKKQV